MWDPDLEQSIGTVPYFVLGTRDSVAQTLGRKGIIAQTARYVWLKKIVLHAIEFESVFIKPNTRSGGGRAVCNCRTLGPKIRWFYLVCQGR